MTERYELKICSNGTYYLWIDGELTDISFDKFNKGSAIGLIDLLNNQCEIIEDLTCNSTRDNLEINHINKIYSEMGFEGVIEYAQEKLNDYGVVKEIEKGLWVLATGGWSEHEDWLRCLNDLTCMFSYKHYRARTRGGSFYYTVEPYDDIFVGLEQNII